MKNNAQLVVLGLFIFFTSCKPKADFNYMQNIENTAIQASKENAKSTIQPNDQLNIVVTAKDITVTQPFNPIQNYKKADTTPSSTSTSSNSSPNDSSPTYLVDSDGNINFPVIGNIKVSGKTTELLKDELTEKLRNYIINPAVSVKIANFKITVLGEVNRPNQYTIPEGQDVTLLNALGLAGDINIYGIKNDILLVRNTNGEVSKQKIDLTDANFMNSPYYYLKQNDVIYVKSNKIKQKTANYDPNTGIYISVASVALTIIALLIK